PLPIHTMFSLRFTGVFLLAVVCSAIALQCYSGQTSSKDKPSSKTVCNPPYGQYCTKVVTKGDGQTINTYDCDRTGMCSKDGCYTGFNNAQICCCGKDLCNSSMKFSSLFAVVPIALIKLLGL
uniref:Activin_recp domain-containing protein n=1 Tax=Haemonchus contortus TaxID=6289 RepID=A0A7I4YMR8_HAECO